MKCEKCQDRGYIELDKIGLLVGPCPDCEKGKEVAESMSLTSNRDSYIPPEEVDSIEIPKELKEVLGDNSDSRIEQDDQPVGSENTSESAKPKKPKAKKKARARAK